MRKIVYQLKNISPLGVHTVSQDPPLECPILLQQHLLPREQGISPPENPSVVYRRGRKIKGRMGRERREKAGGKRKKGGGGEGTEGKEEQRE